MNRFMTTAKTNEQEEKLPVTGSIMGHITTWFGDQKMGYEAQVALNLKRRAEREARIAAIINSKK